MESHLKSQLFHLILISKPHTPHLFQFIFMESRAAERET